MIKVHSMTFLEADEALFNDSTGGGALEQSRSTGTPAVIDMRPD